MGADSSRALGEGPVMKGVEPQVQPAPQSTAVRDLGTRCASRLLVEWAMSIWHRTKAGTS